MGHSAGAHLCMMATLELTLKRLLHSPQAMILPEGFEPDSSQYLDLQKSINFYEHHYDVTSTSGNEDSDIATPPVMISGPSTPPILASGPSTPPVLKVNPNNSLTSTDSFYMVGDAEDTKDYLSGVREDGDKVTDDAEETIDNQGDPEKDKSEYPEVSKADSVHDDETVCTETADDLDTVTHSSMQPDQAGDARNAATISPTMDEDVEMLTPSQREIRNILNSIKHVIGNTNMPLFKIVN